MLDLPGLLGFGQNGVARMGAARFHSIGNGCIHSVGWEANAAGIDEQFSLRQEDGAQLVAVAAENDWLDNGGYAGCYVVGAAQEDARSRNLFKQIGSVEEVAVTEEYFLSNDGGIG